MKGIRLAILFCCIFSICIAFAGCGCTIAQPVVTINGCYASWGAVDNACGYEVIIDDYKQNVSDTSINLIPYLQKGNIKSFKVRALAQGWFVTNSDYSEEVSIEVANERIAVPEDFELQEQNNTYKAMWSAVALANFRVNYCLCFVNESSGIEYYFQTSNTYFEINGNLTAYGVYKVSVFAYVDDIRQYAPSDFTEELSFEYKTLVATPKGVSANKNILSWNNVSGIEKYNVSLLGGNTTVVYANTAASSNKTSCDINTIKNADSKLRDKACVFAGVQAINSLQEYNSPYSNFVLVCNSTMSISDFASCNYSYAGAPFDLCANSYSELERIIHFALFYRIERIMFAAEGYTPNQESVDAAINTYAEIMNISYKYSAYLGQSDTFTKYALEVNFNHPEYPRKVTPTEGNVTQYVPSNRWQIPNASKLTIGDVGYRGANFDNSHFPVNSRSTEEMVYTSDQLYLVLDKGARPVFPSECPAKLAYDAAKNILREIIDDTMTEYQKTLAIFEWLCYNTKYDMNLYDEAKKLNTSQSIHNYRGFYIEGVLFDNGRAVCDGIAKAFSLMCGIENIKCYKAIGTAGDAQHAWNKVYISTPANSERAWYVVDATWSDQTVRDTTTNQRVEYFSHRYFLKTDAELINHHETTSNRQSATTQFDYYTYAKYGSDKSLKIIGNTKLSELQTYISINKPEYFEFRYERGSPTDVKEPTGISGYILVPLGQTEVGTCYYAYVKRKA